MPSISRKQARLMAAAAHTKGGFGGVPQAVGREFNSADAGTGILAKRAAPAPKKKATRKAKHMASHGYRFV